MVFKVAKIGQSVSKADFVQLFTFIFYYFTLYSCTKLQHDTALEQLYVIWLIS